jgi:hypothetical protein
VKESFFGLKISVKLILNPKDTVGLRPPPPYYIQVPRNGYFYQHVMEVDEFFKPYS